jgi:hypothetical protein
MDTINPRWLWVVIFGAGALATFGFLILYKLTKERFAEMRKQQEQQPAPPLEGEAISKDKNEIPDIPSEIISAAEESPEVEVKS